jgi:hypothetical protein
MIEHIFISWVRHAASCGLLEAYSIFCDCISSQTASNVWTTMNKELESTWKGAVMVQLRVLSRYSLGGLEKNTKDPCVGFEVFLAVTLKNAVFCVWELYGYCKNRRCGGTCRSHFKGRRNNASDEVLDGCG